MTLDTNITSFTKTTLKWIINLNVKCTTMKLLGKKIRENLNDLGYSGDFLGTRPPMKGATKNN